MDNLRAGLFCNLGEGSGDFCQDIESGRLVLRHPSHAADLVPDPPESVGYLLSCFFKTIFAENGSRSAKKVCKKGIDFTSASDKLSQY
jgi:hypothetical protein